MRDHNTLPTDCSLTPLADSLHVQARVCTRPLQPLARLRCGEGSRSAPPGPALWRAPTGHALGVQFGSQQQWAEQSCVVVLRNGAHQLMHTARNSHNDASASNVSILASALDAVLQLPKLGFHVVEVE